MLLRPMALQVLKIIFLKVIVYTGKYKDFNLNNGDNAMKAKVRVVKKLFQPLSRSH